MKFIFAGAAYVIVNFAIAAIWNLVLFKGQYDAMSGGFLRQDPIFALGVAAIVINAALTVWLFSQHYPAGSVNFTRALGLTALVMVPNAAYAALVVPAKYTVTDVASFVALEIAFAALLILGLAGALAALFARF